MNPIITIKAATALALGSLLLSSTSFAAPGDILFATEFNTPGNLEGWTDTGNKHVGFDGTGQEDVITNGDGDGVFAARVAANDPQLFNTPLSIPTALVGKIVARIRKSDNAGGWITDPAAVNADLVFPGGGLGSLGAPNSKTSDETNPGDGWTLLEWDVSAFFGQTITNVRWDPLNVNNAATVVHAFEVDYFRIIEGESGYTLETDPGTAIPAGFNLVKEWDTAVQLAQLIPANLTQSLGGPAGVVIGPCSNNAAETCIFGVSSTGDPQLTSPTGLAIPLAPEDTLIIEIGVIPDSDFGTTGSELFVNDDFSGFTGKRRPAIPAFPADDQLHVIRMTFANGTIVGQLKQLRYDPLTAAELDAEVDYIRVYTDTPLAPVLNWDSDTVTAADQGGTGDWNTANSFWYDSANLVNVTWPAIPTGADNAIFGGTAGVVTIDPAGINAHSLTFNVDGYTLTGGDLLLDGSVSTPVITTNGSGVTTTIEALVDGTDDNVRKNGAGTLVLDNDNIFGTFYAAAGAVDIPAGRSLTTTGTNPSENNFALKLGGGTVLNIDGTVVADTGSFGGFSTDQFVVNVNAGADLTYANAYAGWNASVTYNFNGGVSNGSGFLRHQDSGSASINFLDGTHAIGGELGAVCNGNGSNSVVTVSGGSVTAGQVQFNPGVAGNVNTNSYTVNLNGGVLETNRVSIRRGAAGTGGDNTLNLVFNGGTLRALSGGASTTLIDGDTGNALGAVNYNATIEGDGAYIDTNGECKSVDQPLTFGVTAGGGLIKLGAGALYLNEDNTYDGDTLVTAGTLGGSGSVLANVTISAGAGLAYTLSDPGFPPLSFLVNGALNLPDPLVISIDSSAGPFTETSALGLVIAVTSSIPSVPGTITLDTSKFTGLGTWSNARIVGTDVLIDYTAGSDPFASYMQVYFPGETDLAIIGPDADPDGDGVANLKEFAMGGNPNASDGGGPHSYGVNDVGGTDYFTLTIAVRAGATFTGGVDALTASQDGVDYTIDGSADLQGAFGALIAEIAPITTGLPMVPTGYEYKTFQLNPDASAGIGFLRCSVTETP